jgi:hypothetical protein
MLLGYSFKSINGNASLALDIRDKDNKILSSLKLNKDSTHASFPLNANETNKPIELRLYVITDEPGFHVLNMKQVRVITEPMDAIKETNGHSEQERSEKASGVKK